MKTLSGLSGLLSLLLLGTPACGESARSLGSGGESALAGSGAAGTPGAAGNSGDGGAGKSGLGGASAGSGQGASTSGGGAAVGGDGMQAGCFGSEIDIRTALVSGTIKVAGEASTVDYGTLSLSQGADLATFAKTTDASFSFRMIPGTYDVIFRSKPGGTVTLKSGVTLSSSGATVIDVDIPANMLNLEPAPNTYDPTETVTLKGKVTVNGQPAPAGVTGLTLYARGIATQRQLGSISAAGYSGDVRPDTYDIEVHKESPSEAATAWLLLTGQALVARGVVAARGEPTTYDIDVHTTPISGTIKVDGITTSGDAYMVLNSTTAGQVLIAPDAIGAYSQQIIPATYDLMYSAPASSTEGPRNSGVLIKAGVVVSESGPNRLDASVPSVAVAGSLTVAGAPVTDASDDGTLVLSSGGQDRIVLGKAALGSYATRVVPGTYDVYFEGADPLFAKRAPLNVRGKIGSLVLGTDAMSLDIDVPATEISGSLKIDGNFVDKEYDGGRVWLRDAEGRLLAIGWTSSGKYASRVLPGTYDVIYTGASPSKLAPFNASAKIGCLVVP